MNTILSGFLLIGQRLERVTGELPSDSSHGFGGHRAANSSVTRQCSAVPDSAGWLGFRVEECPYLM